MAINKKLIHFKKYSDFVGNSGINGVTSPINGYYHNIHESSIVFIQDTKQIWTHGLLYDGSTFDPTDIEASIQDIKDNYVLGTTFSAVITGINNNLNSNLQGVSDRSVENQNKINSNISRITTLESKADELGNLKANKVDIPTKVSQLDNDACYVLDIVVDNGIYAIESGGNLIPASEATPSCIGVAVVLGEHRFMIGKYTQKLSEKPIWGNSSYLSITNYETVDGTNSIGYLIEKEANGGVVLDSNYHNWTEGALSDFWGNHNTNVMREKGLDGIVTLVDSFNNGNIGDNQGKTDWYVPSCGQLALIVLNMDAIRSVLLAIGGDSYELLYNYWCSTESTIDTAWRIDLNTSKVHTANKGLAYRICLIRSLDNLKSITERVLDLEDNKQDKLLSIINTEASSWVEDTTYADFPYRCDITCEGIDANTYAEVIFDVALATSGNYAPVCETGSGVVKIWSSNNSSIMIPVIIIHK